MERQQITMIEAVKRASGRLSRETLYRRFKSGKLEGEGGPIRVYVDSLEALLNEEAPAGAAANQSAD